MPKKKGDKSMKLVLAEKPSVAHSIAKVLEANERFDGYLEGNYKLSGWQMVKAENAKLLIDGKEVTNDYEFTADKENMEVQIEFTFDGSTLGGKQLVTFEELYDMTNPEEPKKVTEHKDIDDEGQTVTIKEVPETSTPETPGTITKTSNPPKTGDTANAVLWIAILVLSAAGITGVRIWNKKKQVKRLGIEEKKEEKE